MPLCREERLIKIRKYLIKKRFSKFKKIQNSGVEYESRKRHADKRPRDENGRFLNKK